MVYLKELTNIKQLLENTCIFILDDLNILETYLFTLENLEITNKIILNSLIPIKYFVITDATQILNNIEQIKKSKNKFIFLSKETILTTLPTYNLNKIKEKLYNKLNLTIEKFYEINKNFKIPIVANYKFFYKLITGNYNLQNYLDKLDKKDNFILNRLKLKINTLQDKYLIILYSFYYYSCILLLKFFKDVKIYNIEK